MKKPNKPKKPPMTDEKYDALMKARKPMSEMTEEEFWGKMPEHTPEAENGLLSPEGVLYPCSPTGHNWLEQVLEHYLKLDCSNVRDILEPPHNFIKLQDARNYTGLYRAPLHWVIYDEDKVTQAQKNIIFDWCILHDKPMPRKLKYEE